MKVLKYILALGVLLGWSLVAVPYLSDQHFLLIGVTSLFVVLMVTSLVLRHNLGAKNYFTSKWNIFTTLHRQEVTMPIEATLLQQKFEEEIRISKFKLVESNHTTGQILATTKMSFISWGENIYLTFVPHQDSTTIILESVTVFQAIDYEKNVKNIAQLIAQVEHSFTI